MLTLQSHLQPTARHLDIPPPMWVPQLPGSDILLSGRGFRTLQKPLFPWFWEALNPIIADPHVSSPSNDAHLGHTITWILAKGWGCRGGTSQSLWSLGQGSQGGEAST